MGKICTKCQILKELTEYHRNKTTKDGLLTICKMCSKQYLLDNKAHISERGKQYRKNNKLALSKRAKQYHQDNKDLRLKYNKQYRQDANKKEAIASRKKRDHKRRYNADPEFRTRRKMSCRLCAVLKKQNGSKSDRSFFSFVDYSLEQLQSRLDSTMKPEWSGIKLDIDHIKPVSQFKLVNDDGSLNLAEIKKCFALDNLRYLPHLQNVSEGNRRTDEEIEEIRNLLAE